MTLLADTDIAARIFEHIDNKTTDLAERSWNEPVANYLSPARLEAEVRLMRRTPTAFFIQASRAIFDGMTCRSLSPPSPPRALSCGASAF